MEPYSRQWRQTRDALVSAVTALGFPKELGGAIAKHLGSPRAMERMISYLRYVQPHRAEEIVDEMLAIRSEVDAWRDKKNSRSASVRYNEMLNGGLDDEEE